MSKKSRRRNRRLALLGALGAGLMLAGRGKGTAFPRPTSGTIDQMAKDNMPKNIDKKILDVSTPKTIMDSMPKRPKLNEKSIRIKPNTNKIFTIEGAKKGIKPRVGNEKSVFIGKDGYLRQGENATPMTPGRFGTFKAAQEMKRGMLPPQLRVPKAPRVLDPMEQFVMDNPLDVSAKDGGRIVKGEKKAVRVKKKKGIQIRGFGKARRG